jgi:hypothetical protein
MDFCATSDAGVACHETSATRCDVDTLQLIPDARNRQQMQQSLLSSLDVWNKARASSPL